MSATVITFYSFKGGVGRTQALANVAVGLANRGKNVVLVDMDLESPGLHAFFCPPDRMHLPYHDGDFDSRLGLFDFVEACANAPVEPPPVLDWLVSCTHAQHKPNKGTIRLLSAGRLSDDYASRIGAFSWETFYRDKHGYAFFEFLREKLVEESGADYVLVDSRTGLNDVANIGTYQLPDRLFVFFALHEQGLEGAYRVAEGVRRMRDDVTLVMRIKEVFLVPSRVEESHNEVDRDAWLLRIRRRLSDVGTLLAEHGQRIPYAPEFACGERIVVDPSEESHLSKAYARLIEKIMTPGERGRAKSAPPPPRFSFSELRVDVEQLDRNVRTWIGDVERLTPQSIPLVELTARTHDIVRRRAGFIEDIRKTQSKLGTVANDSEPVSNLVRIIDLESNETAREWLEVVGELRKWVEAQITRWIEFHRDVVEMDLRAATDADLHLVDEALKELHPWFEQGNQEEIQQRIPGIIERLSRQGLDAFLAEDRLDRARLSRSRPDEAAQDAWIDTRIERILSEGVLESTITPMLSNLLRLRVGTLKGLERLHWDAYDVLCARTASDSIQAHDVFEMIGLPLWKLMWAHLFDTGKPMDVYGAFVGVEAKRNLERILRENPIGVDPLIRDIATGLCQRWSSHSGERVCHLIVEHCRTDAALRMALHNISASNAPVDMRTKLLGSWLRLGAHKTDSAIVKRLADALVEQAFDAEAFYALEAFHALGLLDEPAYGPVDLAVLLRCLKERREKLGPALLGYKEIREAIVEQRSGATLAVYLAWQPRRFPWAKMHDTRPKVPANLSSLLHEPLEIDVTIVDQARRIEEDIRSGYFTNSFHANWGSSPHFEKEFHSLVRTRLDELLTSTMARSAEIQNQSSLWSNAEEWINDVLRRARNTKGTPDGAAKRSVAKAFEEVRERFVALAECRSELGLPSLAQMFEETAKVPKTQAELKYWLTTDDDRTPIARHLKSRVKEIIDSSSSESAPLDETTTGAILGRFEVVPSLFENRTILFDIDDPKRVEPRRYLETLLGFCAGERTFADAASDYMARKDFTRAARAILDVDSSVEVNALREKLFGAWAERRGALQEKLSHLQANAERLRTSGVSWSSSSDLEAALDDATGFMRDLPDGMRENDGSTRPELNAFVRKFADLSPGLLSQLDEALELAEIAIDEGRDVDRKQQQELLKLISEIKRDIDGRLDALWFKVDLGPDENRVLQQVHARAGDCVRRRDREGLRGLLAILDSVETGNIALALSQVGDEAPAPARIMPTNELGRPLTSQRRFSRHDLSSFARKNLGDAVQGSKQSKEMSVGSFESTGWAFQAVNWDRTKLEKNRDQLRLGLHSTPDGPASDVLLGEFLMTDGKLRLLGEKPLQAAVMFADAVRWSLASATDVDRDLASASLLLAMLIAYSSADERATLLQPNELITGLQRGAAAFLVPELARREWLGEVFRVAAQMGERDSVAFLDHYIFPFLDKHPRAAHGFMDRGLADLANGLDGTALLGSSFMLVGWLLDRFLGNSRILVDPAFSVLQMTARGLRERTQYKELRELLIRFRGLVLPHAEHNDMAAFVAERLGEEAERLDVPIGRPYALSHALMTPKLVLRPDVTARCVLQLSLPNDAPILRNVQIEAQVIDDRGSHDAFRRPAILPRLGANQRFEVALILNNYQLLRDASLRIQYKSVNHEGVDRAVDTRTNQFSLRIEEAPNPSQEPSNPYVVTGAVQMRDRIYGRDKDLDTVWSTLVGEHQDTTVLVSGERRIGKSTLLNAIVQNERFQSRYSILKNDLQIARHEGSLETVIRTRLIDPIRNRLTDMGIEAPVIAVARMQESPTTAYEEFMRAVDGALKTRDRRLLLILDELDYMLENDALRSHMLTTFRAVIEACTRIAFIFAGATEILHRYTSTREDRFFRLAMEVKLRPLDEPSARRLLHEPVKGRYEFTELATDVILRETNRQPYLLQHVGHVVFHQMIRRGTRVVTRTDVDEILQEHIVPQGQIFYDFIKSVPNPTDFNIIQGIASLQFGNRYVSITSLQRELRRTGREMTEEELAERLRTLTESAPLVVERRLTTRQYRLLVGLFARYLRFVAGSESTY